MASTSSARRVTSGPRRPPRRASSGRRASNTARRRDANAIRTWSTNAASGSVRPPMRRPCAPASRPRRATGGLAGAARSRGDEPRHDRPTTRNTTSATTFSPSWMVKVCSGSVEVPVDDRPADTPATRTAGPTRRRRGRHHQQREDSRNTVDELQRRVDPPLAPWSAGGTDERRTAHQRRGGAAVQVPRRRPGAGRRGRRLVGLTARR